MQSESLQEGVDQGSQVTQKLSLEYLVTSNHESSSNDGKDATVMHSVECVGDGHDESYNKDKKDNKFFESHVGSQRHNSNTITGENIAGTNKKAIGCHFEQHFLAEYVPGIVGVVMRCEEDDDKSLQEEDLGRFRDTVE